ncbi:MAG: RDD family protein [Candidatus Omnitrophica bacterium]|nr:RDD family protein [Candidatus Omnitrophota bacterium]
MCDPDFEVVKPDYIKEWRGFNTVYAHADVWKRFLNFVIDLVLISIAFYIVKGFLDILWFSQLPETFNRIAELFLFCVFGVCFIVYYYVFETWFQKTPSKYLTRTKICHLGEGPPTAKQVWIRSLLRLLPFEPLVVKSQDDFNSTWWHDRWSNIKVVNNTYPDQQKKKDLPISRSIKMLAYMAPVIGGVFYFVVWQLARLVMGLF